MRISIYILLGLITLGMEKVHAQVGFMENLGQYDQRATYRLQLLEENIFLDRSGFVILLHDKQIWARWIEEAHEARDLKAKQSSERTLGFQAIAYRFLGARFDRVERGGQSSAYFNFFKGNDPSHWATGVRTYDRVVFREIYPHVDLEYLYADGNFKYNIILHPGADLSDIQFRILGSDGLEVEARKISIHHRFGSFAESMPLAYSEDASGERTELQLRYVDLGGAIGFEGSIPENLLNVIDPQLIFSTYAGNSVDNFGFTATYDSAGNFYSGGIARDPTDIIDGTYPTTVGAFDRTFNGGDANTPANLPCDIAISKYNQEGTDLIYGTYLGGRSDEYPHSMIVNKNNQLIVFGTTYSTNYPTKNAPQAALKGGTDLILTQFNASGSALIGSTYLGGSQNDGLNSASPTKYFYADDFRGEVNLDSAGRIYIATSTQSMDFPTTSGSAKPFFNGGQDGVVACFSQDVSSLRWATYYGGAKDDAIYSIDPTDNGRLYISGGTNSLSLPSTTGAVRSSFQGGRSDGFMAILKQDGSEVIRSSYWGTNGYEQIFALEVDKHGDVFAVGHGTDTIPQLGAVYRSNGKQFISKFDPDLRTLLLSSRYGSGKLNPDITINAFLVDECDKIFISGWGGSIYVGPTQRLSGMPISSDAIQKTTDGNDFHLAVFRRDMSSLAYATYFGGNETDDHVDGGTSRFDPRGVIYQSVCSSCPNSEGEPTHNDFPTTKGAYAERNISPRCSNASFKLAFGNLNRAPELTPERYTVIATDTLDFFYHIRDRDADTVYVQADPSNDLNGRFLIFPEYSTLIPNNYVLTWDSLHFRYQPDCDNIGDTIRVPIHTYDVGCPESKDSSSYVEIVVVPPPTLAPPEVICLQFVGKDAVQLDWDPIPASPYYKETLLYKRHPDGREELLQTFQSTGSGSFVDAKAFSPRKNNYSYFFVVVNICDSIGPRSYELSTIKESEFPVAATYLKTVTVEGDKLRVEWLPSDEDDFGYYEIYRSRRGGSETEFLTLVSDRIQTYFIDSDVDVNRESYCYQIRVSDNCGHLSAKSNIGCSIVIRGTSPKYFFDLYWDDYIDWAGGVESYELIRANDSLQFRSIVWNPTQDLDHQDRDLDLDWGGYHYRVIAHEGAGSENAISRSNDIYLFQPPLVHVPNAVTANGDGLNDHFGWTDAFVLDFRMRVYNRWGELVFETSDKNASWDGLFNGNQLNESTVYVWIVNYTGWDQSAHINKGTVTFLR